MKQTPQHIPKNPGIYLFKDKQGAVLYIGKAKSIAKRVSSYFNRQHTDWKINALITEYETIEFILTENETQALLLEAQLISQYKPKHNTLLKDGQPYLYILVTKEALPSLKLVRNKKEKGTYFGPFLQKMPTRSAYRYLINTFRLKLCNVTVENGCLDYHIGICPGSCKSDFNAADYLFRLNLAVDALKKDHKGFLQRLQTKIIECNVRFDFEASRSLHEYVKNLDTIFNTLKSRFSPKKYDDIIIEKTAPRLYVAPVNTTIAQQLQAWLQAPKPIVTIDCFDISHFQGKQLVGSCVRFTDGKPDKDNFRRFNIKTLTTQNDYAALQEIIQRRYRNPDEIPDLIVIDGGKGQLSAARAVLPQHALCISLAKKEETIFADCFPQGTKLAITTDIGKLLIALRDYTHHFAISFHRLKRSKAQ